MDIKIELDRIAKEHPGGYSKIIKSQYPEEFTKISESYKGVNFGEKLWLYVHGPEKSICPVCGKKKKFGKYSTGYPGITCSRVCTFKHLGISSNFQLPSAIIKKREAVLRGCYKNSGKKAKETYLAKHGNYKEAVKKGKQTRLLRYGSENYNNRQKQRETFEERYGVGGRTEKQKKALKELIEKKGFGTETHKKWLENQGVTNASQLESVKTKKHQKRVHQDFEYLREFAESRDLKPLFSEQDFKGYVEGDLEFHCNRCGNDFKYGRVQSSYLRCPICYPKRTYTSYEQQEVQNFLEDLGISFEVENQKIIGKELDIYIPDKKIAIEYDGLYWHSAQTGTTSERHLEKTELCEKKGIRLIHIFEDEWLFKRKIVESRLKTILGVETDRTYARECKIKKIDSKTCNDFLEKYHIQGADRASIRYGLYYQEDLVAVETFGNLRAALGQKRKEGEYELLRFCSKTQVVGGFSKLLRYFIEEHKPKRIISYADRRWCNLKGHTVYEKAGFKLVSEGTPNYWYFKSDVLRRYHRFSFRKSVQKKVLEKFDENLTEQQNMGRNKYLWIWDCGSYKFQLDIE